MKKLIIPAVLAAILLTAACGKDRTAVSSPRPSVSPMAKAVETFEPDGARSDNPDSTAKTSSKESAPQDKTNGDTNTDAEDNNEFATDSNGEAGESDDTNDTGHSDSVSIINGSSVTFYALYLSVSSDGNPGENIIGDTPLGEGEEINIPFANAPDEELNIIVEDENGVSYSAGGISLANGLSIELRLNNGSLEAITQ